jgi:glycerol-3-phosphate dehydrogenase
VVGPTALDQSSRTDCRIDPEVAKELDTTIQRIIPQLVDPKAALVGGYVGIRPGTDQRDYQIHLVPNKQWVAVAGIRSTGLTASLGIGHYVTRLLQSVLSTPTEKGPSKRIQTTPMPSIEELARQYQREDHHNACRRDDDDHDDDTVLQGGYVNIHGRQYRVTHPLTRFGLESLVKNKLSLSGGTTATSI